mmetsp:Transcript_14681/g.40431  ORF Transcript_14681/g.40431 Transcript_14681/m.40431 type:complete len:230 (+) Transcript_14681:461-1150(+)
MQPLENFLRFSHVLGLDADLQRELEALENHGVFPQLLGRIQCPLQERPRLPDRGLLLVRGLARLLAKALVGQGLSLGQAHRQRDFFELDLPVVLVILFHPLEHAAVAARGVSRKLVDLRSHVLLRVLRICRGLPHGAESLQLLPSAVGLLKPLVAHFAFTDDLRPTPPAWGARAAALLNRHELDVENDAARGPVVFHGLRLEVNMALAPRPDARGDQLHRLLLALADTD